MARDILFHIARTTETPSRAARFVYHWTANAAGRDTTTQAFVDEAAAYVRKAGL
jgi:hypothetical protein